MGNRSIHLRVTTDMNNSQQVYTSSAPSKVHPRYNYTRNEMMSLLMKLAPPASNLHHSRKPHRSHIHLTNVYVMSICVMGQHCCLVYSCTVSWRKYKSDTRSGCCLHVAKRKSSGTTKSNCGGCPINAQSPYDLSRETGICNII